MKTIIFICFSFILGLTKAYEAVAIGVVAMSLIPPRIMFPLDILEDEKEDFPFRKEKIKNETVEDDDAKLRRSYFECMAETHVEPALVKKFKAGSWVNNATLRRSQFSDYNQNHPSLKKWALCVLVKMNMMSPQGVYRYDTAMAKIDDDDKKTVDKIIDQCLSKKAKPPQDIAWNYLRCHFKRDPKNKFPSLGIMYTF